MITTVWAILGIAAVIYALTGGADLGAGLWGLLARGPRKAAQRKAIDDAIAPIWEANHVWLIFVVVVMFAAFPRAFASISIALHVPIALMLLGIVFRGSGFIFRAYGIHGDETRDLWRRVFNWSSSVTPLFLGLIVGGISSGEIRIEGHKVVSPLHAGWTSPFALSVAAFTLALFALLAAVYLAAETSRDAALSNDFRVRALVCEAVCAFFAAVTFVAAKLHAPALYANLAASWLMWPVQIATAASALATIVLLEQRKPKLARFTVALQVALVVAGWGLAMDQHFLLPDLSAADAVTQPAALPAIVAVLAVGIAILAPSLAYLYRIFKLEKGTDNEA